MICKPCRDAADVHSRAKNPRHSTVIDAVEEFHDDCTGCDCQHRVIAKTVTKTVAK